MFGLFKKKANKDDGALSPEAQKYAKKKPVVEPPVVGAAADVSEASEDVPENVFGGVAPPPVEEKMQDVEKVVEQNVELQVQEPQGDPTAPVDSAGSDHQGHDGNNYDAMKEDWSRQRDEMVHTNLRRMFEVDDGLPLSRHLLLLTVFVFFVVFIVWAMFAELDQLSRGEGRGITSQDVQVVQTLDPGTVEEFLVKEGDSVEKGQILMRLSDIEAASDLGANNARYFGLLASITRLQAEAEGKSIVTFPDEVLEGSPSSVTEELNTFRANQQQFINQTNILEQQKSQRQAEVRELEGRAADIRGVLSLQQEEMAIVEPLVARGSAPRLELLQLERGMKEKKSELNSVLSTLPGARGAVSEVNARIREIKTSLRAQAQTELSAKLIELNEIKERLGALNVRKERTELVSPVNGTIQEMSVKTVGGIVRPGEDIIKIIPVDDQLIIEAKIKPSDRANIYPGQPAVVKITAYDFSIYGGLKGKVVDISADTVEDEQGNTFYRVRLKTDENKLKRRGEEFAIIPGMQSSVDIITGKKTVLQYLLKPLIKTVDVAFTER